MGCDASYQCYRVLDEGMEGSRYMLITSHSVSHNSLCWSNTLQTSRKKTITLVLHCQDGSSFFLSLRNKCWNTRPLTSRQTVHRRVILCSTLPKMSGVSLISVACYKLFFRVNIGFINHWLHVPHKKESRQVRSGERAGQAVGPPLPIQGAPNVAVRLPSTALPKWGSPILPCTDYE